jgi:membrane fusion protein, multidrug efflux system
VMPKVAAYVFALHITDNSPFSAGQLLIGLDPRDYQAAVNIAAANLQSARAAETVAESQFAEQSKVIAADQAKLEGDHATLVFAGQQLARYTKLARNGAGTTEQAQQGPVRHHSARSRAATGYRDIGGGSGAKRGAR